MENFKPFSKNNEEQAGQKKNKNTPLILTDEETTTTEQPAPSQILLPYKNAEGKVTQLRFDFGQEYEPPLLQKKSHRKIAKVYKEIPANVDFLFFGNEFVDEFLLDREATILTTNALKIIFNIISQLRQEQFQSQNVQKLDLFENEFTYEDDVFAQIKIKNSLITRDSISLRKAYELLEGYRKGWYNITRRDGRKIKVYGGLVSSIAYEEKGYTTFLISGYWVKKLIIIDSYNKQLYKLAYNVRTVKPILFAFWLSKIPMEGTKVKLETLNAHFDVKYATARDMCKGFLKGIRDNLNRFNYKSFNYNYIGDIITIKPYLTNIIDKEATIEDTTKEKIEGDYQMRYFKDRHQLSDEEMKGIEFIYEHGKEDKKIITGGYKRFVEFCRERKEKTTDYIGVSFLEKLQYFVEIEYHELYKNNKHAPTKCPIKVFFSKEEFSDAKF
ncbi:hypothetical protein [uncultured Capnocytophaga sp.]|uniref:hypothetical protein n=1 Tax=uncultured Capnocytophaga sp. TaxID=159273 RepID=UPI00261C6A89|nr:hypothetical protein [uncultured Capnocytophaga sp.]